MEKKTGIELISEERERQKSVEGWNDLHDEGHNQAEMAGAAGCYIASYLNQQYKNTERFRFQRLFDTGETGEITDKWDDAWPWDWEYDKRKKHDKIKSLKIAGALIAAEIDRLLNINEKIEREGE